MSMTLAEAIALLAAGNPPSPEAGFLGVDVAVQDAALVLLGVPWEATTSYGGGTATAPAAIVTASHQLDVQDAAFGQFYRHGITMVDADAAIARANARARPLAKRHIEVVPTLTRSRRSTASALSSTSRSPPLPHATSTPAAPSGLSAATTPAPSAS
jgi:hypothetical protein